MKIILRSHGLKTGIWFLDDDSPNDYDFRYAVPKADLYLDCRSIRENGIVDAETYSGGGKSLNFQEAVKKASPQVLSHFVGIIEETLLLLPSRKGKDWKGPFIVLCNCAWGMHRSVATKFILAERLKAAGHDVEIQ